MPKIQKPKTFQDREVTRPRAPTPESFLGKSGGVFPPAPPTQTTAAPDDLRVHTPETFQGMGRPGGRLSPVPPSSRLGSNTPLPESFDLLIEDMEVLDPFEDQELFASPIQSILNDIISTPGFDAALCSDSDGALLQFSGIFDAEMHCAVTSIATRHVSNMLDILGLGDVVSASMSAPQQSHYFDHIEGGFIYATGPAQRSPHQALQKLKKLTSNAKGVL